MSNTDEYRNRLITLLKLDQPELDFGLSNFGSHLTALRWLQYFPSMTSCRISALSFSSAYIFFRRRFSSSSSFNRFISEALLARRLSNHVLAHGDTLFFFIQQHKMFYQLHHQRFLIGLAFCHQ